MGSEMCIRDRYLTKWTTRQDAELFRLMCYIHTTKAHKMTGWVNDPFHELQGRIYSDSDFAGCEQTSRSTNGIHTCLLGKNTYFPLSGQSKRQGCISQSTTEAELVAASLALRTNGLPLAGILEALNAGVPNATSTVIHCVDNQAMMEVVRTGRNPTMRHLGRVHGVCSGFMHEQYGERWTADDQPSGGRGTQNGVRVIILDAC